MRTPEKSLAHSPLSTFPSCDHDAAVLLWNLFFQKQTNQKTGLPVVLVTGLEGAGMAHLVGLSLPGRLARFRKGGRPPQVTRIPLSPWLERSENPVLELLDAILGAHPGLRRRVLSGSRRKRMRRVARASPLDAGRLLGRHLIHHGQGSESKKSPGLVNQIIQFEEVDRLFESELTGMVNPTRAERFRDVLGFLRGLESQQSVLFSLSFRSWTARKVLDAAEQARFQEDDLIQVRVDFPGRRDYQALVKRMLEEMVCLHGLKTKRKKLKKLIRLITKELVSHPECIRILPELLDGIRGEAEVLAKPVCVLDYTGIEGFAGLIGQYAEQAFLRQSPGDQKSFVWLFLKMVKNRPQRIDFEEMKQDKECFRLAFDLVRQGIFSIQSDLKSGSWGDQYFQPLHPGLFSRWKRPRTWLSDSRILFRQPTFLREIETFAENWAASRWDDRLLLSDRGALDEARRVMQDSSRGRFLTSQMKSYLEASVRRHDDLLRKKKHWATGVGISVTVVLLCAWCLAGLYLKHKEKASTSQFLPAASEKMAGSNFLDQQAVSPVSSNGGGKRPEVVHPF